MTHPFLRVAAFAVAVVSSIVLLGELITRVSGEGGRRPRAVLGAITPDAGEAIFWGKGKCHICHAVGTRGNAVRGPNQGDPGPLGRSIGARAEARARERARATGTPYTATDYLVESLTDPGAYVVPGYRNEMPDPTRPPIKLLPDEVRAVVTYLQSLGGAVDPAAIRLPERVVAAATAPAEPWSPYLAGDPRKGEALFFDPRGNAGCAKCHMVGTRGAAVGPALTQVAATRDPRFLVESILEPSKVIASGFEPILVVTTDGRHLTGVVKREDAAGIEVVDAQGEGHRIPTREIRQKSPQPTSLMPENFREILTVEELHDLLAFLLTLR